MWIRAALWACLCHGLGLSTLLPLTRLGLRVLFLSVFFYLVQAGARQHKTTQVFPDSKFRNLDDSRSTSFVRRHKKTVILLMLMMKFPLIQVPSWVLTIEWTVRSQYQGCTPQNPSPGRARWLAANTQGRALNYDFLLHTRRIYGNLNWHFEKGAILKVIWVHLRSDVLV